MDSIVGGRYLTPGARVCADCMQSVGDVDGVVRVLTRWGPPLRPARMRDGSALRLCLGPFSRAVGLRLQLMAVHTALHCARDQVTCTARARQRGVSERGQAWCERVSGGFGWHAAVGLGRGNVSGSGHSLSMVRARRERENEPCG